MINEINRQSVRKIEVNPAGSKAAAVKSVKADAPSPVVMRSAASLAASAGLPADKLSSSIVSFARFFSLPLKKEMLAGIRRQALSANKQPPLSHNVSNTANALLSRSVVQQQNTQSTVSASDTAAVLKTREAVSLAASAAESKGVELNQKALETYSQAIDPDWKEQHGDENQNSNNHQNDSGEKNKKENDEKKQDKEEIISADFIKKLSGEFTKNNQLLIMLNKLPLKNGKRWIVLPFEFADNENQFIVSMRILLDNDNSASRMALQITQNFGLVNNEKRKENGEQFSAKKWLFGFEFTGNKLSKVIVYLKDELNEKEQNKIKKELSMSMKIPIEYIFIKYSLENFPSEADDDQFISIDEAV